MQHRKGRTECCNVAALVPQEKGSGCRWAARPNPVQVSREVAVTGLLTRHPLSDISDHFSTLSCQETLLIGQAAGSSRLSWGACLQGNAGRPRSVWCPGKVNSIGGMDELKISPIPQWPVR